MLRTATARRINEALNIPVAAANRYVLDADLPAICAEQEVAAQQSGPIQQ